MAKQNSQDTTRQYQELKKKITSHIFSPVYALMGEEPYFPEELCKLIIDNAMDPTQRDFNQSIVYGADTNVSDVISLCCAFPMMSERVLVVVKEAQSLRKIEELVHYFDHIVETTVLVLLFSGASADKRTTFYKNLTKYAEVFESSKMKEESVPSWIESNLKEKGKKIEPQAALLLAEYAGNDLKKLSFEIDKLIRAIDIHQDTITSIDIERNVGISREFNDSELTNAIAKRDTVKCFKLAYYFGESPKQHPIQKTIGSLFFLFNSVELVLAHDLNNGTHSNLSTSMQKAGFHYYSYLYDTILNAARNYSLKKVMKIISLLRECDYKSKSNYGGEASDGDLLVELIGKILA